MKKFLSMVIAATFIFAPLAQASAQGWSPPEHRRTDGPSRMAPPAKPQFSQRQETQIGKRYAAPKRFDRGQRLSKAQRSRFVDQRDLRRYRLAEPRRGERWVRVDDQFLLINAVSGLIRALGATR